MFARTLGLAALAWVSTALALSAQTYSACRVPGVGAIYMINVSGAPSACLDASHVQFSWTEGGQVADNAVTAAKIANGAVTYAKMDLYSVGFYQLRNNSVGPQSLGFQVVSVSRTLNNDGTDDAVVSCPAGKMVLSGGYRLTALALGGGIGFDDIGVHANGPLNDTQWVVSIRWPSDPSTWSYTAYAICFVDGSGG